MGIPISVKTGTNHQRTRIRGGPIHARLLVGFVLMALLSAVGIGLGSTIVGYANGRQQVQDRLDSVAASKALAIKSWANDLQNGLLLALNDQSADERINIVLDLAGRNEYYDWYNGAVRLRLRSLIEQSRQFDELCLLDPDGTVVLCTGEPHVTENCKDAAFFQRGLVGPYIQVPFQQQSTQQSDRSNRVGTSELLARKSACHFQSAQVSSSSLIAARPITGSNGQVLGVIAGRVGASELARILSEPTGLGQTGRAYLTNSLLARYPDDTSPSASSHTGARPPSKGVDVALATHSSASGIYTGYQGEVFRVYRWLPDLQVVLGVEQSFTEAFAGILMELAVNAVIAVAAVLLAVVASFLITRSITQPLVGLVETASEIAAGDLERTAVVRSNDEIGALAIAFNTMTARLRDLINHLEERVQERTQALRSTNEALQERTNALRAANEKLQQRAVQMETSAQVSRQITSILNIGDLLARVVPLIRDAFGYDDARIFLVEEEELVLHTTAKSAHRAAARLRLSQTSLNTEAVRTNQAVVVNDVTRDKRYLLEEHLDSIRSQLVIPLRMGERVIGTLDVLSDRLNAFAPEDVLVVQSLADQVAIAIENARLYERSQALALLEGRTQLARDLHDSVNQSLYSLNLLFEGWRGLVRSGEEANVDEYFNRAAEIAQQALGEMRILLYELRPATLEEGGLVGALQRRLDAVEGRAGIKARLSPEEAMDLPPPVQDGLYHIAQEALNNALKHAGASEVSVRLHSQEDQVTLQVTDNGHGFVLDSPESQGGMGLTNMRQRAKEMGGTLSIESAPGQGTTVTVKVVVG